MDMAQKRLANQQINGKSFETPEKVVRWLGAVQSQDYPASLWAVGLRTKKTTEKEIERAIAEKKIVRTWPMRGTLHLVSAEDVRWMQQLLTPRVLSSMTGRYRQLELDDHILSKSGDILQKELQGGKQLTRPELYQILEQQNISTDGQRGYHILSYLAQKSILCFGRRRGRQFTFTLLDEWVPGGKTFTPEEALAELSHRYLQSHGPATVYDFAAWSGLTVTSARQGFESIRTEASQYVTRGHTYWFLDTAPATGETERMHLLPAFDEILCGYKDRSAILKKVHEKTAILRNGMFKPTVIDEGNVIGTWSRRTLKSEKLVLYIQSFNSVSKPPKKSLTKAAERYGRFLNRSVTINMVNRRH